MKEGGKGGKKINAMKNTGIEKKRGEMNKKGMTLKDSMTMAGKDT